MANLNINPLHGMVKSFLMNFLLLSLRLLLVPCFHLGMKKKDLNVFFLFVFFIFLIYTSSIESNTYIYYLYLKYVYLLYVCNMKISFSCFLFCFSFFLLLLFFWGGKWGKLMMRFSSSEIVMEHLSDFFSFSYSKFLLIVHSIFRSSLQLHTYLDEFMYAKE